jgi:hypothetical protein
MAMQRAFPQRGWLMVFPPKVMQTGFPRKDSGKEKLRARPKGWH